MTQAVIPFGRVVWQSARAKTYQCPVCLSPLFSQYEGEALPTIACYGPMQNHILCWSAPDASQWPIERVPPAPA